MISMSTYQLQRTGKENAMSKLTKSALIVQRFKDKCKYFDDTLVNQLEHKDKSWFVYVLDGRAFMTLGDKKLPDDLVISKSWKLKGPREAQKLRNFLNSLQPATLDYCVRDSKALNKLYKEAMRKQPRTSLAIALLEV